MYGTCGRIDNKADFNFDFDLCNKICFRSLCCPLSVQNYYKLKRIHANIVQNPTFLGRFQTFGGQCKSMNEKSHSLSVSAFLKIASIVAVSSLHFIKKKKNLSRLEGGCFYII